MTATTAAPLCGAITALMTGVAYATSAEMAERTGPLPRLCRKPRRHAAGHPQPSPRRLRPEPRLRRPVDPSGAAGRRATAPTRRWSTPPATPGTRRSARREVRLSATPRPRCIAPTGTIGLVMDCDTTGIEPDFALVKFKKLAGGGYFKIINRMVPQALETLGYDPRRSKRSSATPSATARLKDAPGINHADPARPRASTTTRSTSIEEALADRLRHQLRLQQIDPGRGVLHGSAGASPTRSSTILSFDMLAALGFTKAESTPPTPIAAGAMTLEGAPS